MNVETPVLRIVADELNIDLASFEDEAVDPEADFKRQVEQGWM